MRLTPRLGCAGEPGVDNGLSHAWALCGTLEAVAAWAPDALVVVDIPIGLTGGPPRPCDAEARRRLGPRRSSVFTPPMRGMLTLASRAEATAYGQARRVAGGLSAQSWNIVPKIKEADAFVTPGRQGSIREGHPELAFARLNGAPLPEPKKSQAGADHRTALLRAAGVDADALVGEVRERHPRRAVADDDVRDAAALALTGLAVLCGEAVRLGGERDATGRIMEILG